MVSGSSLLQRSKIITKKDNGAEEEKDNSPKGEFAYHPTVLGSETHSHEMKD